MCIFIHSGDHALLVVKVKSRLVKYTPGSQEVIFYFFFSFASNLLELLCALKWHICSSPKLQEHGMDNTDR